MHYLHMDIFVKNTIDLAKRSRQSVTKICEGAEIKSRWYHRFINGDFKDPGYGKVTRLHNYLVESERLQKEEDAA